MLHLYGDLYEPLMVKMPAAASTQEVNLLYISAVLMSSPV